jgi:hypothetical protein
MIRDQAIRRKRFIENVFWGMILIIMLTVAIRFLVWFFDFGRDAGKW